MNSLKDLRLGSGEIVLESPGYGQFPDVYKLTPKGIALIKEVMLSNIKGELEFGKQCFEAAKENVWHYIDEYSGYEKPMYNSFENYLKSIEYGNNN